jgi:site-specific recombinase XerD
MTDKAMSPLRRRMIEDMTMRKFAPKTQHDYVQRVKNFATFLGRSPDMASFEDVRRYQLHLTASGVGVPTINQTISTLRFFFRVTPHAGLGYPSLVKRRLSHSSTPPELFSSIENSPANSLQPRRLLSGTQRSRECPCRPLAQ